MGNSIAAVDRPQLFSGGKREDSKVVEPTKNLVVGLLGCESDPERNEVAVSLRTAGDQLARITFAGRVIMPLLTQLYACVRELKTPVSGEDEGVFAHPWPIKNVDIGVGKYGPVLLMEMPGGRIAGEIDRPTLEFLYQSIGAYLARVHEAERGLTQ